MSNGLLIDAVAHYKLDETSTTADRVDDINGYNLSPNPLQPAETGKIGLATVTATPADFADLTPVPADFIFGSGQSFSIQGWIQQKATNANNVILSQWNNATGGSAFLFFGFGTIARINISPDGTVASGVTLDANLTLAINTWYHLVAVYDGVAETIQMYTSTESTFNVSPNTQLSAIGGAWDGATNRLRMLGPDFNGGVQDSNGRFDEITLWRRPLSVVDVEALWNGGAALPINQWDSVAPEGDGGAAYNFYYRQRAG